LANVGVGERIGGWWRAANATQRALLLGGIVAGVLSTALVVRWSARPDFVVLFSGLGADEASKILEELDDLQVPHEVAASGGTIRVPSDRVGELRIRVAGKGLTGKSTVGYEIFDRQNLGMTDFLQHVNYRRALEGELTRTVASLEEVRNARVHLAIPERDVFLRDRKDPKASVIVDLEPGARLRPEQVRGVYALVAASVEGLRPENVTVVDASGRELGGGGSGEFAATTEQLRIQQEVETALRNKATALLEQVVGGGNASVQVTAALDFERSEKSVETYDPEKTVIRSEQRITGNGTGGDSQETTLTNYEMDKTVEKILGSVGTIQRLSIAVLVNGVTTTNGPRGAPAYADRSPEELATFTSIVQDAVGYDETRGDTFEIASLRFAPAPGADLTGSPLPWWLLFPSTGSLLRSLLLLVAIALVAWGLRQSSSILVSAVEADRKRRERVVALEKQEDEASLRREVIREQMNELAQNRPNEVAQVLRGWLVEEKTS
jgi:flagellar M-ring protein FliF